MKIQTTDENLFFERIENSLDSIDLGQFNYVGMEKTSEEIIKYLWAALFPNHYHYGPSSCPPNSSLRQAYESLLRAMNYVIADKEAAEQEAKQFIMSLPEIKRNLQSDIVAAYEGDPAATGYDEIILTYPAFKAISIYRIAHQLYCQKIPVLPRMLSEYGHFLTGVDIHPGATIGDHFFIDHGTGVVIGETTTIGHHVKIYQNVTLGAKSFVVGDDGELVKGIKRHPDIGNNVVIYSGASILGGDSVIGDNCVIGGNVWLTHSVEPNEKVVNRTPEATR
ncbi:MAG: serine acetyltransferase [Lachnospiraceae bacterium]|nr:serine acetyltransferase [Lachnospiraceae bacterium]